MSAWAMAVCFRGMTARETADLTLAMARSGEQMDLTATRGVKVDKHSTGGVGDKTTLIVAPLVAAAGVPVAKMSGRGLGHTGGTIDKLEAIPGFNVERSRVQFIEQVNKHGLALVSQSGNLTPADKKLYGLRDVTATVESIPLIASSIMSKKLASGADAIVLDVKTGGGAFMKTLDGSIELAQAMVAIGEQVGRETVALITDMDEPLGFAIGNALEVKESIETLRGNGPADLQELCIALGAHMLVLGKRAADFEEAQSLLREAIGSGAAIAKLRELIDAQGGDIAVVDDTGKLPGAAKVVPVIAESKGYVAHIDAESIGIAAMLLGAGRATKDAAIDYGVGIVLRKKVGDPIAEGDTIADLYAQQADEKMLQEIAVRVQVAYRVEREAPARKPLVYAVVTKDGVRRLDV
jgi:pyrimidine-nucleoside phosphorylase